MKRDSQVFDLISEERNRQMHGIELIASENFVSDEVMEAMGSVLTNKYAEGYPAARYYGGCQVVDKVENLAIELSLIHISEPKKRTPISYSVFCLEKKKKKNVSTNGRVHGSLETKRSR